MTSSSDVQQRDRIITHRFGFSLVRPAGWFVWMGGDLPIFYSFPAEAIGPKGEFPDEAASINVLVRETAKEGGTLRIWADQLVTRERGVHVEARDVIGPDGAGAPRALEVSFDQPGAGRIGPTLHVLIVVWQWRAYLVGAELQYEKGDAKGRRNERILHQVVDSFKPQ